MYEFVFGTWPNSAMTVFYVLEIALMLFAAYSTGAAMANNWRNLPELLFYCFLLTVAGRFLAYSLFDKELLSVRGFLFDLAVIIVTGFIAFRLNRAHALVKQYPWLYEAAGPFGVRKKREG